MGGEDRAGQDDGPSIQDSAHALLRAVVGGLLVGLPLLWTQEMWTHGTTIPPLRLLVAVGAGFLIVLGFNALSGFRRDRTWLELVVDAVQGMGLAVLIAVVALLVLGRLDGGVSLDTAMGRVALEAVVIAFGTALASTVLGDPDGGGGPAAVPPLAMLFVAAGGALYFALNVAPTDEVRLIGAEADARLLLLAVVTSLGVGLATELSIRRHRRDRGRRTRELPDVVTETVAAYAVALLVSYLLLWVLGLVDGLSPRAILGEVVMLGIVAMFGAAAGRVLVGRGTEAA